MVLLLRKRQRLLPVADVCLTIKDHQRTLRRQVARQFEGKRAPDHIKANWPGCAWIEEVLADTTTRSGKGELRQHLHITNFLIAP